MGKPITTTWLLEELKRDHKPERHWWIIIFHLFPSQYLAFCSYVRECKAYIVEEMTIFILFYLEPKLTTRINCVPRHDDGREVPLSANLSLFSHIGQLIPKNIAGRSCLSETKFRQVYNYMFFNHDELRPFID